MPHAESVPRWNNGQKAAAATALVITAAAMTFALTHAEEKPREAHQLAYIQEFLGKTGCLRNTAYDTASDDHFSSVNGGKLLLVEPNLSDSSGAEAVDILRLSYHPDRAAGRQLAAASQWTNTYLLRHSCPGVRFLLDSAG